jgi:hypothetical protein
MAKEKVKKTKASAQGVGSLTPMQRAEELLRQMTVEEKAMQLSSIFPLALFTTEGTNRSQLDALLKNGIGHISALGLLAPGLKLPPGQLNQVRHHHVLGHGSRFRRSEPKAGGGPRSGRLSI